MARPIKRGLDYFPLDIDFFEDEKIQFVTARFNTLGEVIVLKLLMRIYRNGYYLPWDDDAATLFAMWAGQSVTTQETKEVVDLLLARGFFSAEIYARYQVLTSSAIQRRYFGAVERRKEVEVVEEYLLAPLPARINVRKSPVNECENLVDDDQNAESKVEESKEEENNLDTERRMRVEVFEQFFFKNFRRPADEVEKFFSHYGRTGWIDMHGNKVVDLLSAARCWDQRVGKKEKQPPMPPAVLQSWRNVYERIRNQIGTEKAVTMLFVDKFELQGRLLTISCSFEVYLFIEKMIGNYNALFHRFFPNMEFKYTIPESDLPKVGPDALFFKK